MDHTIKTDRLILQPLGELEFDFIRELSQRLEYNEFERDKAKSHKEVTENCQRYIDGARKLPNGGAIQWVLLNNNVKIGEVHIKCNWEETHEWEIGWNLLIEYWGNGFAFEATKAVIKYGFTHFKIRRLIALLHTENKKSAALAERVGMIKEGRLRENRLINEKYYDEYIYGILKHEVN